MEEKENNKWTFALIDFRQIQNFIFSTNKLKENLGASLLVKGFEERIERILKENILNNNGNEDGLLNIEQLKDSDIEGIQEDFKENFEGINIAIGGGNAFLLFKTKEQAVDIT